jgi:hypothetical protein
MQEFLLFGGTLYRLGSRFGLVRNKTETFLLGVALGMFAWLVLIVLALFQGLGLKLFSLDIIGFIQRSWLAEIFFLLAIAILPLFGGSIYVLGRSGSLAVMLSQTGGKFPLVLGWHFGFCLPLFRFLMIRRLWHLALWWYFLWRLQKRNLHLVPTHPDGTAGLGYREVVQEHFIPLALAISAILSASFAEDILSQRMVFESLYNLVPVVLFLTAVMFIGPLFIFSRKLWICRVTGLSDYSDFAFRYVNAFDLKWIRRSAEKFEEPLLGTPDLQSLADLNNSFNVVRAMRWIPMSSRLSAELLLSVILPLLPLVFLKYDFNELMARIFKMLINQ